jgi:DNA-directed RNA polymerase specialized sigma24 family protein
LRHGGQLERVALDDAAIPVQPPDEKIDLIELDTALEVFAKEEPRKAELVKLRYFVGLSEQDAADVLGISRPTAARWWAFSRAWLYERMSGDAVT